MGILALALFWLGAFFIGVGVGLGHVPDEDSKDWRRMLRVQKIRRFKKELESKGR